MSFPPSLRWAAPGPGYRRAPLAARVRLHRPRPDLVEPIRGVPGEDILVEMTGGARLPAGVWGMRLLRRLTAVPVGRLHDNGSDPALEDTFSPRYWDDPGERLVTPASASTVVFADAQALLAE